MGLSHPTDILDLWVLLLSPWLVDARGSLHPKQASLLLIARNSLLGAHLKVDRERGSAFGSNLVRRASHDGPSSALLKCENLLAPAFPVDGRYLSIYIPGFCELKLQRNQRASLPIERWSIPANINSRNNQVLVAPVRGDRLVLGRWEYPVRSNGNGAHFPRRDQVAARRVGTSDLKARCS